jgi:hypothetical protein
MQTPSEVSSRDDLSPYFRHLRDEYWDFRYGNFGVLTPQTHIYWGQAFGPWIGDNGLELPNLGKNEGGLIGTFARFKSVLSASGRAIYTDVTFTVGHVFLDAAGGHAALGGEITIDIIGGTVRTPSGEIISEYTEPRAYFMQPGRTYVLWGLVYEANGGFYTSGIPDWELLDGVVRANFDVAAAKAHGRATAFIGLTQDELIPLIHERFLKKRDVPQGE